MRDTAKTIDARRAHLTYRFNPTRGATTSNTATSAAGLAMALATRLAGRSVSRAAPACKASSMRCSRSRAIKSALRAASVSVWLLIAFSPAAPQCRGVVLELFQGRRERRRRIARYLPQAREDQHGDRDVEKRYSADCLETVLIPEIGDDKQRREKQREKAEHDAHRRQQHHVLDVLARFHKLLSLIHTCRCR